MSYKRNMVISIAVFIMTFVGSIAAISSNDTYTGRKNAVEAIAIETTVLTKQLVTTATTNKTTKPVKATTTTTSKNFKSDSTSTTTVTYPFAIAQNPTVSAVSVSCLKVEWVSDIKHSYSVLATTEAPYTENIHYVFSGDNVCYITGLRENSDYHITLTPVANTGENIICVPFELNGRTQAVEVIEEFEREEGWTSCFAGERASGLTAMPSSGAIYGSFTDNITGTGIRRKENGDYCCAMGLFYGTVGDRFLIELDNGIQFTVQICDSKGWADDSDGDGITDGRFHWFGGERNGKNIIEFIYDDYSLPYSVAFYGSWGIGNWNGLDLCSDIASIKKINY